MPFPGHSARGAAGNAPVTPLGSFAVRTFVMYLTLVVNVVSMFAMIAGVLDRKSVV